MARNNNITGSTAMLLLKLLEEKDMYGYQIIEELAKRSEEVFRLKTGTLYPVLHGLENDGMVSSYEESAGYARVRKYYRITSKGRGLLSEKELEWRVYSKAVNGVIQGGLNYAGL